MEMDGAAEEEDGVELAGLLVRAAPLVGAGVGAVTVMAGTLGVREVRFPRCWCCCGGGGGGRGGLSRLLWLWSAEEAGTCAVLDDGAYGG